MMSRVIFLAIFFLSYFMLLKSECDLSLFLKNSIVPSVIPTLPKLPLTIILHDKPVSCGDSFSTYYTLSIPEIHYDADDNSYYTLIMIDADAPYPESPFWSLIVHWFVINIPGDDIDSGENQIRYINPLPAYGSASHRYIFIVLKQASYVKNYRYRGKFSNFDLKGQMEKLGLSDISFGHYFNVTTPTKDNTLKLK